MVTNRVVAAALLLVMCKSIVLGALLTVICANQRDICGTLSLNRPTRFPRLNKDITFVGHR